MTKNDQIIEEGHDEKNSQTSKDQTPPSSNAPNSPKKEKKGRKKGTRFFLIVGLVILASGWIYALWTQNSLKRQYETQLTQVNEKAIVFGDQTQKELLLFSLKSAGLGIRSEWMRNNLEQIDLYLGNLAQHPRVGIAQIIDEKGMVLLSSDKHLQGNRFIAKGLADNPLNKKEASFYAINPEEAWVFAPILGIDKRLGTLMLRYQTRSFSIPDSTTQPEIMYKPAQPETPVQPPDSTQSLETPVQKTDTLT